MACVYIPVQNSSEEVRVQLDQLPRDATDILDILKAEQAPLNLWLTFAREYFKQGKINEFLQILVEGSSPEIDEYYSDVKYDRIAILNALGAYYTNLGKVEQKQREKDEHSISATQYYNRASRIDQDEPTTWVGKGQLLLAKGDLEQSFEVFKIVLEGQPDNVPAILGQACVQFNRDRYQESLSLYKKALQVHPMCPASVRLGLGLCRYRLGQVKKARQAFERVLQLDPGNVEALVALGVMNINSNESEGVREGLESMKAAFEIYPFCAMALNHLANHFFFTGQHYIVDQLMEAALVATDHTQIKAHSYYNLARSYHTKAAGAVPVVGSRSLHRVHKEISFGKKPYVVIFFFHVGSESEVRDEWPIGCDTSSEMGTKAVLCHPFVPIICIADEKETIRIWDYEQVQTINSFENHNAPDKGVSKLCLLNELENSLLLVASSDGSVRVWKDYMEKDNQRLATAWQTVQGHRPGSRGISAVVDWQQSSGFLYASGEISSVMVWDLYRELLLSSIPSRSDSCIYAISASHTHNMQFGAGCGDGYVRLFDVRTSEIKFVNSPEEMAEYENYDTFAADKWSLIPVFLEKKLR